MYKFEPPTRTLEQIAEDDRDYDLELTGAELGGMSLLSMPEATRVHKMSEVNAFVERAPGINEHVQAMVYPLYHAAATGGPLPTTPMVHYQGSRPKDAVIKCRWRMCAQCMVALGTILEMGGKAALDAPWCSTKHVTERMLCMREERDRISGFELPRKQSALIGSSHRLDVKKIQKILEALTGGAVKVEYMGMVREDDDESSDDLPMPPQGKGYLQ